MKKLLFVVVLLVSTISFAQGTVHGDGEGCVVTCHQGDCQTDCSNAQPYDCTYIPESTVEVPAVIATPWGVFEMPWTYTITIPAHYEGEDCGS